MEEAKKAIKKTFKIIFSPKYTKRLIQIFVVVVLLLILLASAVYFVTVDDGTYKEDDWSSAPYAANQYTNGVSINDNGTFKTNMNVQELWDKMLQNKNRVDEYLSTPAELARLMKAELVTQYPDTRPKPDEEIDWDNIKENPDALQGIIKFKRADTSGNKNTISYVSPETFQGYIDTYNQTGSEEAKQNALTHFTLKKTSSGTETGGTGAIAAGEGIMTDVSQVIIDAASPDRTPWPGANWCARWVRQVYENAGVGACRHATAYEAAKHHIISTDKSAIPIGAAVYGTGSNSGGAGHVGIYIGGGKIVDSVGSGIKTWNSIEEWTAWQKDVLDGKQGWLGWGWQDNNKTRGTTEDPNLKENNITDKKNENKKDKEDKEAEKKKATIAQVDGDGYMELYTSSAGITYKHFKQSKGSYAGNPYWNGTVSSDGCGPSSVAILASGLLNSEYTPGDIAAQMNATYGITSYETLKGEMDSLGMASEVIQSPSAETIQDNLRNGKVILVSVNSNTIFTNISHIMAIVDINEQGQVYVCNPGSSSLQGWYDIGEIMKGCQYIVVTDAGAVGVANTKNTNNYVAVVATWSQKDTYITTNDPNVEKGHDDPQYSMTTTNVNYEEMVAPYTMPFDMLWALLVVGEDKEFIFELVDLIYNSEIEITIHDNLTVNTDIDEWHYTQETKAEVHGMVAARIAQDEVRRFVKSHEEPHAKDPYTTTKTVITQTNTLNVALTKANVWIVKYNNEYTYIASSEESETTNTITKANEEYPDLPSYTGDSYSCNHIAEAKQGLLKDITEKTGKPQSLVTFTENIVANYYMRYIDIYDNITNRTRTQKYVQGLPEFEEKIDPKAEEPNFVTIFNKAKYRKNKINIKNADEWLFEIIETNDSTKEMLDLIKYLLYKATGNVYDGVESFDFSIFYPTGLLTVGEGDYIVHIDKSSPDIVIRDLETLKRAFSGYSGSAKLVEHAQEYLDLQEEYRVNAVFAAAVSISETSAGRAGHAVDGKNNWYNIECVHDKSHGRFENYGSAKESIEAFYKQISVKNYYFTAGKFTVSEIGMVYCEDAGVPGGWIENTTTFMTQMFNAAGITPTTSGTSQTGTKIVEEAKTKLGCPYVWGAEGPDKFDCSGLTKWAYKQVGIDLPHNTDSQKNAATKVVSVSEARVGDILYRKGHVGIYIGNDQYIHAPQTGDVVRIANGANYFTHALQFY